jgi:multiple sugar transport system permease protein
MGRAGSGVVRFLVLLPWTTSVALSSICRLWLLDSSYSPIDWVLRQLGVLGPAENMYWLGQPGLSMTSVIAVHVWRLTPLAAVIVMAGLVAIARDIEEAARVDGAGYWRRMVPLVLPVIAVSALCGGVFTFTDIAVIRVLTRGGSNDATQVLASWAFYRSNRRWSTGTAGSARSCEPWCRWCSRGSWRSWRSRSP